MIHIFWEIAPNEKIERRLDEYFTHAFLLKKRNIFHATNTECGIIKPKWGRMISLFKSKLRLKQ